MSKAKLAAQQQHLKFLKRMGLTQQTIAKNKPSNMPRFLSESIAEAYNADLSNNVGDDTRAGSKKGIMHDLEKYTEADRAIAAKLAKRVAPLYSKGPTQVISDNEDLTTLGKKI